MQLPPTDELVLRLRRSSDPRKKARYYEDRRLAARILPPPSMEQGGFSGRPASRPCDWNQPPVPSRVSPVANGSAAVSSKVKRDQANAGIRREPALPEHESIVLKKPRRVFAASEDEPDDEDARARTLRQRMKGVARQAAMDPDDGISL